ncbi:peptidase [Rugosibacter aromaticivorans]|uniref:Peptidase n=1 Tax=Rugosibacter aromaticivorans TaxID=1565605 RepID=A0A0C5JNI5_9PROT|nr:M48 family metalloprotease [Rugosibacter aromaticivorans]AJP48921.1 peptidase [Rugosibacter aromaticivorans]TBR14652.1 MAG: peptidase [Rugosibacter sp.]
MKFRTGLSVVTLVFLAACANVRNPVTGQYEHTVMDERSELQEGQKAHQEVLKEYRALDNPPLQAYVNSVGQRLAKASHRGNLEWHFTVLDSPEVNAFALPGGYVYITRGILAYLNDEAELAGVLGHEIGHVAARHASQRATRQQAAGVGVLLANVLGAVLESKGYGGAGDLTNQVSQITAAGYIASYSREQESQADQLGAEYLARNHYDSARMIDVIRMLKNQAQFAADMARKEGRPVPPQADWLASHPSNDQRLDDIRQTALLHQDPHAENGRERYLKAIDSIPFGESREEGVTRGQQFFHEPLGFALTAPAGWRIKNTSEALIMTNGAGDAALIMRTVPADAGATHADILRTIFNPINGRTTQTTINGFAATSFVGTARVKDGAQEGSQQVDATLVTGPDKHPYLFLHAAKSADVLQRERETLLAAEKTFRAINDKDRSLARPWRLCLAALPQGGLAQLAKRSPTTLPHSEAQLRLMNGVYPDGVITPGAQVKVVE